MALRVAVIGGCAAGKTSLVNALRVHGYDAFAVAQEHSSIPELWRHQNPDRVVMLEASLDAVRVRRRNPTWPAWIWELQQRRLEQARVNATILVDTDRIDRDEVVRRVVTLLDLAATGRNVPERNTESD